MNTGTAIPPENATSSSQPATATTNSSRQTSSVLRAPVVLFNGFIGACEWIGESVAGILGLDNSYYQEYLDMMTPQEMAAAEEVLRQRQAEDAAFAASQQDTHPQQCDSDNPNGYSVVLSEADVQVTVPVSQENV